MLVASVLSSIAAHAQQQSTSLVRLRLFALVRSLPSGYLPFEIQSFLADTSLSTTEVVVDELNNTATFSYRATTTRYSLFVKVLEDAPQPATMFIATNAITEESMPMIDDNPARIKGGKKKPLLMREYHSSIMVVKQTNASQETSWVNCTMSAFGNECLERCNTHLARQVSKHAKLLPPHYTYEDALAENALALRANARTQELANINTHYGAFVWQPHQNTIGLHLRRYGSTEIAGSNDHGISLAQPPILRLHWHNGAFTLADDTPLER